MRDETTLREEIFQLIEKIFQTRGDQIKTGGKDYLNYVGSFYDHKEIIALTNSVLDGWFGLGKKAEIFQKKIAEYSDVNYGLVTNSGSSANLLTIAAFCSHERKNRLKPGDEIITPAATFPTTLNPILQYNLVPVFLDVKLGNYNIETDNLSQSISDKTKGIMIPHVLGNPNEMDLIMEIAEERNLFVIEDCCDALGTTYKGKKVGSFGDFGTLSLYPAHHITMGEGGVILTNNRQLMLTSQSLRDWGRACFCKFNESNLNGACNKRFDYELNGIKIDHRYMYSNIGYNLKPLEFQCAMALEQLNKLPKFIELRKRNFKILYEELQNLDTKIILPEETKHSDVSWFAFPITIRENTNIKRNRLQKFLEKNKIQSRVLFAGNILNHPPYKEITYRKNGDLKNTEIVFKNTFFVGVYPALTEENMVYIASKIKEYFKSN